jgi:diguanylate cyclase (GGDEF)-like protein/PAS domain S-box-containing protein
MHMPQKRTPRTNKKAQTSNGALRHLSDPQTLANLATNLQGGIYITNESGEILDGNPALLEILGMPSMEEMKQYRVTDFMDGDVRRRELELIKREGSLKNRELELRRPDGHIRTVLDTSFALNDSETGERLYHGILVDITERKTLETALREQSLRDPLTGCYNRRFVLELANRSATSGEQWGCIYVDVDDFKQYNDVNGHAAGDTVLLKMSRFLMRHVRAEEAVVRMGGDEFLVVLLDTSEEVTERVVRRLQAAAKDTAPVPFSLGWAARRGSEGFEDTVNRADRALIGVRVVKRPESNTRKSQSVPHPTIFGDLRN